MPRKPRMTAETEKDPFPKVLRKELEERGMSQGVLAKELGVARQTISLYCTGQSSPDVNTLCKIADFLDVSTDYLLGRTEAKTTNEKLRLVCDYTGLSEDTVGNLMARTTMFGEIYRKCLSMVISSANFDFFLHNILRLLIYKHKYGIDNKTHSITVSKSNVSYSTKFSFHPLAIVKSEAIEAARLIIDEIIENELMENTILDEELHTEVNKLVNFLSLSDGITNTQLEFENILPKLEKEFRESVELIESEKSNTMQNEEIEGSTK